MSKDGGAAFPRVGKMPGGETYPHEQAQNGMSLRVYLMAHAPENEINELIPGKAESLRSWLNLADAYSAACHYHLAIAKARRIWADAMIAESDK